jgi:hypothetical protein
MAIKKKVYCHLFEETVRRRENGHQEKSVSSLFFCVICPG